MLQTQSFDSPDFDENRVAGLIWGLETHALFPIVMYGLSLTTGNSVEVGVDGVLHFKPQLPEGTAALSVLVFELPSADRFGEFSSSKESSSPRQVVGFEGGTLHVLAPDWSYEPDKQLPLPPIPDRP